MDEGKRVVSVDFSRLPNTKIHLGAKMPITMNTFHCPNGHTFEANAKLRARCPECGAGVKRSFEKPKIVAAAAAVVEPKVDDPVKPKVKPIQLVRAGRPRVDVKPPVKPELPRKPIMVARKKPSKPTIIGSKAAGGLISRHRVKAVGVRPQVTGKPPKTAAARHVGKENTPIYWHEVSRKYGF